MITPQITIPQWLQIPTEIRYKIAEIFKLVRSSGCIMVNNVLTHDGYTHEDLAKLTVERMQEYLSDVEDKDLFSLINKVIEKVRSDFEREREIEEQKKEVVEEKKIEEFQEKVLESVKELTEMSQNIVKKRGRPPKA